MASFTTRLNLRKPGGGSTGLILPDEQVDIDQLNDNFDKIDAAVGYRVVTSGTRPATPFDGQGIYETDTKQFRVYRSATTSWDTDGNSRGNRTLYLTSSPASLDAITDAIVGDLAWMDTPGVGIESLLWVAFAGAGAAIDWRVVETVRAGSKANLDAFIAVVAAITDTLFPVGGFAVAAGITYQFTSTAGVLKQILPSYRFKGTITTAKTPIASQFWGKSAGSVTFNTTDDPSAAFNATTGLWTCPPLGAGTYLMIGSTKSDGAGTTSGITFHKNGTKIAQSPNTPAGAFGGYTFSYWVTLVAGDTLGMQVTTGYTTVVDTADNNFFEIVQVQV